MEVLIADFLLRFSSPSPLPTTLINLHRQLTAFAFRDYVRFGYVDQGEKYNTPLLRRFNINTHAPTMLLFKEDTEKPADIIQVAAQAKASVGTSTILSRAGRIVLRPWGLTPS